MNELFYLAVSLARDREMERQREWGRERENQLQELVDERREIRRAILLTEKDRRLFLK